MFKIALTGGIGTGKTFVSQQFKEIGIPIFYADEEAKKLYADKRVILFMHHTFGDSVFTSGKIDFAKLSQYLFSDSNRINIINQFLHPLVMEQFEQWAQQQEAAIVMMESALIFESHLEEFFDKIIVVDAPLSIRKTRIQSRNPQLTMSEIEQRIAQQIPQEEKCKRADLVIDHSVNR